MKLYLLLTWLAVVAAKSLKYEPISSDYHELIGIPEASRIQQAEAALDFDGSRIVGGQPAGLASNPNTRLVTAAHCWRTGNFQGRQITVVLGSTRLFSGGHRVNTNNIQLHGSYNMNNLNNDIAIITIPRVGYTNNIRAVELPSGLLLNFNYVGERAVAAGYGRSSDCEI